MRSAAWMALLALGSPSGLADAGLRAQANPEFTEVAERAARLWDTGVRDSLLLLIDEAGARITLPEGDLGLLDRRQAGAALSGFLEPRTGQGIVLQEARVVAGTPETAYAQLVWSSMRPGIPELERFTVFLGFRRSQSGAWRLGEMRVLR